MKKAASHLGNFTRIFVCVQNLPKGSAPTAFWTDSGSN